MPRITPIQVAMGVGVSGAMTDVSTYADLEEGITRTWGRRTEFDDVPPGTFSFTLDNADGRFTPGNTASPLSTTVTEGMSVAWNLGGRLVAGTIQSIEPQFPHGESAWSQIQITCDDQLGNAGRRDLGMLVDSINAGATPYLLWPLDDAAGTVAPRETENAGSGLLALTTDQGSAFGAAGTISSATQLTLLDSLSIPAGSVWPTFAFTYPTTTLGFYSFWVTPVSGSKITATVGISGLARTFQFGYTGGSYFVRDGSTPLAYAWTGTAHGSTSTRTTSAGVVTNRATNPSSETNSTNWSSYGGGSAAGTQSRPATGGAVGTSFQRFTWSAGSVGGGPGPFYSVPSGVLTPLTTYSATMWVRSSKTQRVSLNWEFYNAASAYLGGGTSPTEAVLVANTWTQLTTTGTAPATTDKANVTAYSVAGTSFSNWAIGDTYDADAIVIVSSGTPVSYFDGDTTPANVWAYTADNLPHFVSMGLGTVLSGSNWVITASLYVDGTLRGTVPYDSTVASLSYRAPTSMSLFASV